MSRMLRTARAEMAATLGFISLAADKHKISQKSFSKHADNPLKQEIHLILLSASLPTLNR